MSTFQKIPTNFIYPDIKPTDFKVGAVTELPSASLRKDGDWRDYVPNYEDQSRNGIESSSCYIQAQTHSLSTIEEEKFDVLDRDDSARFNALLSGGTEYGGDPLRGAESIKNDGLIPESMLPFSDDIKNWNEYHSWKGGNEELCRRAGKRDLENRKRNYHIVFQRELSVEEKYKRLKFELQSGPPCVSVLGWYLGDNGMYIKPEGTQDNHFVELVFIDENNCAYVWDTYQPSLKKLEPFYNFDFAMGWRVDVIKVKENLETKPNIWQLILSWLQTLFAKKKTV